MKSRRQAQAYSPNIYFFLKSFLFSTILSGFIKNAGILFHIFYGE